MENLKQAYITYFIQKLSYFPRISNLEEASAKIQIHHFPVFGLFSSQQLGNVPFKFPSAK